MWRRSSTTSGTSPGIGGRHERAPILPDSKPKKPSACGNSWEPRACGKAVANETEDNVGRPRHKKARREGAADYKAKKTDEDDGPLVLHLDMSVLRGDPWPEVPVAPAVRSAVPDWSVALDILLDAVQKDQDRTEAV